MKRFVFLCLISLGIFAEDEAPNVHHTNQLGNRLSVFWINLRAPFVESTVEGNNLLYGSEMFYIASFKNGLKLSLSYLDASGSNDFRKYDDDGFVVPKNASANVFKNVSASFGADVALDEIAISPCAVAGLNYFSSRGSNSPTFDFFTLGGKLGIKAPINTWYDVSVSPGVFWMVMSRNLYEEKLPWYQNTVDVPARGKKNSIGAELLSSAEFRFGDKEQYVIGVNPFIRAYRFDYRFFAYGGSLTAAYAF